jgi:hypothetical protein
VPIYCAQCGKQGGMVPEANMTFACWLCDDCYHTHGALLNATVIPDEVFWAEVAEAQREKYGRNATAAETAAALHDPNSLESLLARSRAAMTPKPSQ